jgi:hypothetical protein
MNVDFEETEGALARAEGPVGVCPVRGSGSRYWPKINGRPVNTPGMPAGGYLTADEARSAAICHQTQARLYLAAAGVS